MANQKPLTALEKIVRRAKTRKGNLQKKLDALMADAAKNIDTLKAQISEQDAILKAMVDKK